ncbi:stealth conserved region 3 domain-containing protein [Myxococcota bacterium]|nr:stealth conserved region 3 domain-containing protein [Myxococcota bacterium]
MLDVVYTWVDGDDPAWQERKRLAQAGLGGDPADYHASATGSSRFKNRDELKYSLRSLDRFAPWVRRVYLVTDHQVPDWIDPKHSDLRLVSHAELFADAAHLPTFNSHAIESNLHRIPELGEHFVYFNDDVLLSAPSVEADFFDPQGRSLVYLDTRRVARRPGGLGYDLPVNVAARNCSRLLESEFDFRVERRIDHVPQALRRSILEELWARFPAELAATSSHAFRHPEDLSPTSCLAQYYSLCTDRAVTISERHLTYIKIKKFPFYWVLSCGRMLAHAMLPATRRKFMSVNDAGALDDSRLMHQAIAAFFEALYPEPSRFER